MERAVKTGLMIITIAVLSVFLFNNGIAATITASSCSYDYVKAAYDSASEGDTIMIPAGSATWSSTLTITKSITLVGSTSGCPESCNGATTITGSGSNRLIYVNVSGDKTIDIGGLTLDGNSYGGAIIHVNNTSSSTPLRNFILRYNELKNSGSQAMSTGGLVFGLIHNNKFSGNYFDFRLSGDALNSWTLYPGIDNVGTNNYTYIEDNISNGNTHYLISSGSGARWVYRHNTVTGSDSMIALWDMHGDTNNWGIVAAEIYENTVDTQLYEHLLTAFDYRGGTGVLYNNTITTSGHDIYMKIREEQGTKANPCGRASKINSECNINNGYVWNNLGDGSVIKISVSDCNGQIAEDTDWWDDGDTARGLESPLNFFYDVAANRPGTCKVNDVYWETDNKKLYRCTNANEWTFIYAPYTYPHPLILPSRPSGLKIVP